MGSNGGTGACLWLDQSINLEIAAYMEGLYNSVTNVMSRPQVERLYLRKATAPFAIVEPASGYNWC